MNGRARFNAAIAVIAASALVGLQSCSGHEASPTPTPATTGAGSATSEALNSESEDSDNTQSSASGTPTTISPEEQVKTDELAQVKKDTEDTKSRFDNSITPSIPAGQACLASVYTAAGEANAKIGEINTDLVRGDERASLQDQTNAKTELLSAAATAIEDAPTSVADQITVIQGLVASGDLDGAKTSLSALNQQIDLLSGYLNNCDQDLRDINGITEWATSVVATQQTALEATRTTNAAPKPTKNQNSGTTSSQQPPAKQPNSTNAPATTVAQACGLTDPETGKCND